MFFLRRWIHYIGLALFPFLYSSEQKAALAREDARLALYLISYPRIRGEYQTHALSKLDMVTAITIHLEAAKASALTHSNEQDYRFGVPPEFYNQLFPWYIEDALEKGKLSWSTLLADADTGSRAFDCPSFYALFANDEYATNLLFDLYAVHTNRPNFRELTADKLGIFINDGDNDTYYLFDHIQNNPNFAICFLENNNLNQILKPDALKLLVRKNLYDETFMFVLQNATRTRHELSIYFDEDTNPLVVLAKKDKAYRDEILADDATLQRLTNIDIATIFSHCNNNQDYIQQIKSACERIGHSIDQIADDITNIPNLRNAFIFSQIFSLLTPDTQLSLIQLEDIKAVKNGLYSAQTFTFLFERASESVNIATTYLTDPLFSACCQKNDFLTLFSQHGDLPIFRQALARTLIERPNKKDFLVKIVKENTEIGNVLCDSPADLFAKISLKDRFRIVKHTARSLRDTDSMNEAQHFILNFLPTLITDEKPNKTLSIKFFNMLESEFSINMKTITHHSTDLVFLARCQAWYHTMNKPFTMPKICQTKMHRQTHKATEVDLNYQRALKEAKRDIDGLLNFFENPHHAAQLSVKDIWQVLKVYENNPEGQETLEQTVHFVKCIDRLKDEIRTMVRCGNMVSTEKLKKLFSNKEIQEMQSSASHDAPDIPLTNFAHTH